MNKASVVIATLNRQKVLIRALKALLKQKENILEIIIVDQTEKYPKFLKNFVNREPLIKYFHYNIKNLPSARNYGWQKALAEIIIFIDDDSIVLPNHIKNHLKNFQNPIVGGVTGKEVLELEPEKQTTGKGQVITKTGDIRPNTLSITKGYVDSVWGANMSFRKKVLEEINGFDPGYKYNAMREESDVSMRAKIAGYKIMYEPSARVIHLAASTGGCRDQKGLDWYYSFFRNEIYFFKKYFPPKYLFKFYMRKLRPILVAMFLRGKASPKTLILPYKAFKEGACAYEQAKGKIAPLKIAIDAREAYSNKKAGKGKYSYMLIKNLMKLDRKNLYFLYTKKPIQEKLPANFENIVIKSAGLFWFFAAKNNMKGQGADLIFSPTSYVFSYFWPKMTIPVIHDLAIYQRNFKSLDKANLLEKIMVKRVVFKSKIIITISKSTKKDLIQTFDLKKRSKIKIIYPGIEAQNLIKAKKEVKKLLKKHYIKKPYILSVGTIEPRKNHLKLIQAYAKLKPEFQTKFDLVIVGKKGWHYEKVFQIINKMKLNKKIHFIDYASDTEVIGLYSQAKLFAFPSLWEGFGIPVIEAMSVGCPVITSLNSSLPEAGGKAVKYINPKKVLEIKKAIELMLQSQNQENIEKGFIQAKKFDWEKSSRKLLEIFDNSINNK